MSGFLLLDKPLGMTSNEAVQRVKRLYQARKVGHTGSLDPLASGLLPLCLGDATKLSAFLLDADKGYRVKVRLGVTTTTADAEGEVTSNAPTEGIEEADIRALLPRFTGAIEQVPPMYSALKHKGDRLYKLARQGIEVEREPRRVSIHALDLVAWEPPEFVLDVHCSKGTYVRTLAEDIGRAAGCGAHVAALRRTAVGPYQEPFVSLDVVEAAAEQGYETLDALLLPLDSGVAHWPKVRLSEGAAYYVKVGQPVMVPRAPTQGWVRLYAKDGRFLGVGSILDDGRVQPKRLLAG